MSNDNTLPEEVKKELFEKADAYANQMPEYAVYGIRIGYIAGAIEYAQWKVKFEQAKYLLEKVNGKGQKGFYPDTELFNEINQFLNGPQ